MHVLKLKKLFHKEESFKLKNMETLLGQSTSEGMFYLQQRKR